MPAGTFLFINKDASSKSLTNNQREPQLGVQSIHKHVQRHSALQRRQQAATVESNARGLLGWRNINRIVPIISDESIDVDNNQDDVGVAEIEALKREPREYGRMRIFKGQAKMRRRCKIEDANVKRKRPVSKLGTKLSSTTGTISKKSKGPRLESKLARRTRRVSCSKSIPLPRIEPAIDALPGTPIKLTANEHRILEYFLKEWMPSAKHIPQGCQIAGFTPVWPGDELTATVIMRGVFQSQYCLSIWALLAAAAKRMQKVKDVAVPELYSYRAVAALRKCIESGLAIDEPVVLDLAFLILFDYHTNPHIRTDVYWKLNRDLIVQLGGLHRLHPFTARISVAYDNIASIDSHVITNGSVPGRCTIRTRSFLAARSSAKASQRHRVAI